MKKLIWTLLVILTFSTFTFGQTITYENFKEVIPFLQKEDFKGAFEKTSTLLKSTSTDNSDMRGIVTYMNIFSAAGMVSIDEMTYDEFEKVTKKFIGQNVIMSGHPCIGSSENGFNSLQFITDNKGKLEGMTITSNNKKTQILCFEYFDYADKINPNEFIGKNVRSGGILSSVEINPTKSKIWIARLRIKDAFARDISPR